MKRLALALALCIAPSLAWAQCSGVFPNGSVCGNATGSSNTPRATPSTSFSPSLANPTASVGLTAVNGSASTAMRSDAAPPLSQAITPTWSGQHTFSLLPIVPNQTANTVWAGPTSGLAGTPAFRALVGADLPFPSASTLGGIESYVAVTHQWINAISTLGVPSSTQPAFTDISGNIAVTQMNSGTAASSSTFWRGDGTWALPGGHIALAANTTFYVNSATGNDANPCSLAAPCLTLQHTRNYVQQNYDLVHLYTVTYNVTGTFNEFVIANGILEGQSSNLNEVWDLQSGVVINGGNQPYGTFAAQNYAQFEIRTNGAGATLTANGASGVCIGVGPGIIGTLNTTVAPLILSGCGDSAIYVGNGGGFYGDSVTFVGNANQAMLCSAPAVLQLLNGTGTFSGGPTYANGAIRAFSGCLTGVQSENWSGTFTGPEVTVNGGAVFATHALPGSAAAVLGDVGIYNVVDRGGIGYTDKLVTSGNLINPTYSTGTHLQVVGANTADSRIEEESYGGTNYLNFRRTNGTSAAPTGLVSGNQIGLVGFSGRDSASNRSDPQAQFTCFAGGTWSGTSRPTYCDVYVTNSGTITSTPSIQYEIDGGITIPPTVTGGSKGAGTVNSTGNYYVGGSLLLAPYGTGTSGGVPYFNSTTTLASSALLAANQIMLGGGAATAPATLGSLGTTTTVLHGNAAGAPSFAAVSLTADVSGTLPVANGGTAATTAQAAMANLKGVYVLGSSGVQVTHTGDTAEFTLGTVTIPANAMGANGSVRIVAGFGHSGGGGTWVTRVKFGGTAYYSPTTAFSAVNLSSQAKAEIHNRNATNSQVGNSTNQLNSSENAVAVTTSAIDTTSAVNVTFTGQLTSSGDIISLEYYTVELYVP